MLEKHGLILEEERLYFESLLEIQNDTLRSIRVRRKTLLWIGLIMTVGSLVAYFISKWYGQTSGVSLIQVYAPLGIGLVITTASAYPPKEVAVRQAKVVTYQHLLSVIERARKQQRGRKDIEAIQGKLRTITDELIKEC